MFGFAGLKQGICEVKGINKACAGRVEIHCRTIHRQVHCQNGGLGRRAVFTADGGEEDVIQLTRCDAGIRQGFFAGLFSQGPHGVPCHHPAFFDAGPLGDPLIRGIHQFLQHGIGEAHFRLAGSGADDFKTHVSVLSWIDSLNRSEAFSFRWFILSVPGQGSGILRS